MATIPAGTDTELLEVIATRAAEMLTAADVEVQPEKVKSPEELFLEGKPTFKTGTNRATFKEVFGWTPRTIPNIPVPKYDRNYWDASVRDLIPEPDKSYYMHKSLIEEVVYGMFCDGTVLLYGPTGTGKTRIVKELAARFCMPFLRVSCHGQMEQSEFLGTNQVETDPDSGTPVTKHSDTDTTLAAKFGGLLVIDEAFRAPSTALMSIQSLLEYPHTLNLQDAQGIARQYEVPLNDFKLVLTDNTNGLGDDSGNYTAEVQDVSTLNRVRRAVYIDYMPVKQELDMLQLLFPDIPTTITKKMVDAATLIRASFKKGKIQQTVSIRELISWCASLMDLRNVETAFKYAVLNRLGTTDSKQVCDIYRQVFNVTIRG